ncbi:hypothetical protein ACWKX9_23260 [Enterobacter asburiae]
MRGFSSVHIVSYIIGLMLAMMTTNSMAANNPFAEKNSHDSEREISAKQPAKGGSSSNGNTLSFENEITKHEEVPVTGYILDGDTGNAEVGNAKIGAEIGKAIEIKMAYDMANTTLNFKDQNFIESDIDIEYITSNEQDGYTTLSYGREPFKVRIFKTSTPGVGYILYRGFTDSKGNNVYSDMIEGHWILPVWYVDPMWSSRKVPNILEPNSVWLQFIKTGDINPGTNFPRIDNLGKITLTFKDQNVRLIPAHDLSYIPKVARTINFSELEEVKAQNTEITGDVQSIITDNKDVNKGTILGKPFTTVVTVPYSNPDNPGEKISDQGGGTLKTNNDYQDMVIEGYGTRRIYYIKNKDSGLGYMLRSPFEKDKKAPDKPDDYEFPLFNEQYMLPGTLKELRVNVEMQLVKTGDINPGTIVPDIEDMGKFIFSIRQYNDKTAQFKDVYYITDKSLSFKGQVAIDAIPLGCDSVD